MTLEAIAVAVLLVALIGLVVAARSAPAVSLALLGGIAGGMITIAVISDDGPHGAPASIARGISVGILLGALLGLVVSRRRPPGTWPMRRPAIGLLVATPFAVTALLFAIRTVCPMYVTRHAGMCFYDVDVMGGWSAEAAAIAALHMVLLAAVLLVSPGRDAVNR